MTRPGEAGETRLVLVEEEIMRDDTIKTRTESTDTTAPDPLRRLLAARRETLAQSRDSWRRPPGTSSEFGVFMTVLAADRKWSALVEAGVLPADLHRRSAEEIILGLFLRVTTLQQRELAAKADSERLDSRRIQLQGGRWYDVDLRAAIDDARDRE